MLSTSTASANALSRDQLSTTIRHAREVPGLPRFLLGRFFYSDAVNTVIVVMSVVAVEAVGLSKRNGGHSRSPLRLRAPARRLFTIPY